MQRETHRDAQRDRRRGVEAEGKTKPRAQKETGRQGHGAAGQTVRGIRRQRDPRTKHKADLGTERGTDTTRHTARGRHGDKDQTRCQDR